MRTIKYLLEKEFKQIFRDKIIFGVIFIIPVFQLSILPFAANFELKNISIGIVDEDHFEYSQQLTEKILSSGYFHLKGVSSSYEEGMKAIESNTTDILIEIPNHFERDLGKEGKAEILIAANAVNGTKGGLGSAYISSIIQSFNEELGYSEPLAEGIVTTNLFNPHLDYKHYMVPGIMVFLLTLIGGFLAALNIVSEKEKGTIEQINVSPVPKSAFLLAKLIPFWAISLLLLTISMFIAWLLYGLIPVGSFWIIYVFAFVYLIAFTGFGLLVSAVSSTQQQAMFSAFFFIIIFALMSGLFTPINSMPDWAQTITLFNPVRYFVEVMRMIYLKGSTFSDIAGQFGVICLFAVVFNTLAVVGYRKSS